MTGNPATSKLMFPQTARHGMEAARPVLIALVLAAATGAILPTPSAANVFCQVDYVVHETGVFDVLCVSEQKIPPAYPCLVLGATGVDRDGDRIGLVLPLEHGVHLSLA